MVQEITFDYFYGGESEQFSYYRIPRLLVTGPQFRKLSTDAKLLYGLMLDRMGLSAKNGWYDEKGKVFIYYAMSEIQCDLNCGHDKAIKMLAELDSGKGIGLIERIKQGQGKPARIYVKRFVSQLQSRRSRTMSRKLLPEFQKAAVKTSTFQKSRLRIFRSQEVGKSEVQTSEKPTLIIIIIIYPDRSYLYPSIHPSERAVPDMIDRRECREEIKESIEYNALRTEYRIDELEEIVDLMTDVLCSTRPTLRIGGEELSTEVVKARFWRLDQSHIEYVLDRMKATTTKIRNIRGYLLTALYNAPATIGHHFQAEVQHDLYGQ